MKRVLITGGSGRLGRYVVQSLINDYEVKVFDLKKSDLDCTSIVGNVLDRGAVAEAVKYQDAVIHLAALDAAVPATDEEFMQINVEGTWNLFDSARTANVSKVVYCSSVAALNISEENPPHYLPIDIEHSADPVTAYGLSKLVCEKMARRFSALGGMEVICLRPAYVILPDEVYTVAKTTAIADATEPPPALSEPSWQLWDDVVTGSRSFIDPRDAAMAFKAALEVNNISWGIFHVVHPESYSALDTLTVVKRELGVSPILRDSARYAEGSHASIYDISETIKKLRWKPVHDWTSVINEVLSNAQCDQSSLGKTIL
jgi:UDP-glucose 4-epimerase